MIPSVRLDGVTVAKTTADKPQLEARLTTSAEATLPRFEFGVGVPNVTTEFAEAKVFADVRTKLTGKLTSAPKRCLAIDATVTPYIGGELKLFSLSVGKEVAGKKFLSESSRIGDCPAE